MDIIYQALYVFFIALEIIILAYIILSLLPYKNKLRIKITELATPILEPIRYLLDFSIFKSNVTDFSPIISYIIINFMQNFFLSLL